MSWLIEDPTIVLAAGAMILALLVVAFFRTGRVAVLGAMGGVVALAIVLVLIERFVVTEVERVGDTLHGAAAALEANDLDALLGYIDPEAGQLRNEVRSLLGRAVIQKATARNVTIIIPDSRAAVTAHADFLGVVSLEETLGDVPYDDFVRRMRVHFVRRDDRWLVTGYEFRQ